MQRGWSTENLVGIAQSGFTRIRKMLRPADGEDQATTDLLTLCRRVDERVKQGGAHGSQETYALFFEAFVAEVRLVCESSQPGEVTVNPAASTESVGDERSPRMRRSQEHALASFFDTLLRIPPLIGEHLVLRPLLDAGTIDALFRVHCNTAARFTRKLIDAATHCLLHILSQHPVLLAHAAEHFANALRRVEVEETWSTSTLMAAVRTMLLLTEALRRADLSTPDLANEAKALFAQAHGLQAVRGVVKRAFDAAQAKDVPMRRQPELVSVGVTAFAVLGGLIRSNIPIRTSVLEEDPEELFSWWAYFASAVDRMLVSFNDVGLNPVTGKPEEQVVSCESHAVCASELAGFALEACTSDSFNLQRQRGAADDASSLLPTGPTGSQPAPNAAAGSAALPRWEHLPPNWDTVLGSAVLAPWRIAAALSRCVLTAASARLLLRGLAALDLTEPTPESVFRAVCASLMCLCRANPTNTQVLHQAGAIPTLLAFMAPRSATLPLPADAIVPIPSADGAAVVGDVWPVCGALLTTLLGATMPTDAVELLMGAIENMVHEAPTRDDCDTVETCLSVLASSNYVNKFFWFEGSGSRLSAPLERMCGRWYGYSFAAWISPSCIWPEGSMLFSVRDPLMSSALALCVVANGRTKCLAIKTATSRDQFSLVLIPDAVVGDRWHHVAAVHNISGFTVYVDGRKCGTVSAAYPKEPAKPHRLWFGVGSADKELQVPSFFGMMASAELIDGVLSEVTLEKVISGGVGSTVSGVESLAAEKQLAVLAVGADGSRARLQGALVREDGAPALEDGEPVADGVPHHCLGSIDSSLNIGSIFEWAQRVFSNLGSSTNRSSVAILALELLAGTIQQRTAAAVAAWSQHQMTAFLGAELCAWDNMQPEVLSALFALIMADGSKKFRQVPMTKEVIELAFDLALSTSTETRGAMLREISEYLDEPANASYFNQNVGVGTLLQLAYHVENAIVTEYAHVLEKVVRQQPELEAVLRFIVAADGDDKGTSSSKKHFRASLTVVKCELLRMIYEVSKARPATLEMVAQANGVQTCLILLAGETHDSETLRVLAIRTLALLIHAIKKQREVFQKLGHFDTIAAAILSHSRTVPVGLPTFNALFKFSLDFYQPSSSDETAVLTKIRDSPQRGAKKAHADPAAAVPMSLNGHTPSMAQVRPLMCRAHSITSIGSSDMSDVDARLLSMDDTGDGAARDTLAHPHCIQVVCRLLSPIAAAAVKRGTNSDRELDDAALEGIGSDMPSAMDPTAAVVVLHRVLRFLHRMVELSQNAAALVPHPWLDWLWHGVAPLVPDGSHAPNGAGVKVENAVRAIIRVVAVADMARSKTKGSMALKRAREMVDAPAMQRLVLEEVVRHFATHHRLDTMDADDAAAVVRNLAEGAFTNIEDAVSPLPLALGLEMVRAVETIAVNNTIWVRQKMKACRTFELRDRLALYLLHSTTKSIAHEAPDVREALLSATMQDVNAPLVVLKAMCDAAKDRDDERFDALHDMLRKYYAADEDQRKVVVRAVGDNDMVERLVNERTVVGGAQVRAECFVVWIAQNEAAWEAVAQRVLKAAKAIETDFAARAEKRDRENTAKQRSRQQELEKRNALLTKMWAELERSFAEVVLKAKGAFSAAIAGVDKARASRAAGYTAVAERARQDGSAAAAEH